MSIESCKESVAFTKVSMCPFKVTMWSSKVKGFRTNTSNFFPKGTP